MGRTIGVMADVTILHNPNCSTSRHAMDTAVSSGTAVDVVQYLKTPPNRDELQAIIDKLEDPTGDLVRKDRHFTELGLNAADYMTPDAVIDLLLQHPRLMQGPVLVRGDRAIIGRPKDRVEPFLRGE